LTDHPSGVQVLEFINVYFPVQCESDPQDEGEKKEAE
jgi:hypothetical protein